MADSTEHEGGHEGQERRGATRTREECKLASGYKGECNSLPGTLPSPREGIHMTLCSVA